MQFRDLRTQYAALKDAVDEAALGVLETGTFIGGQPVKDLEKKLAAYVGVKHCISCANGTDALQLALMAWGIGPGDAVFVPDFTFFSSGEVVSLLGATPIFVDVDPQTFNVSASSLEYALCYVEKETDLAPKAVVAVDLFGLPADYPALRRLCDIHELLILEDGAQGFGGAIQDRKACSFGDISTTSFFPAKPLGCYGDGGAIFTDSDEWALLLRSYAIHGKGSMKYDNVRVGMNSRLDTLQAAILLPKFHAFVEHEVEDVNQVATWYDTALAEAGLVEAGMVLPLVPEGFTSSWAQYTLQLPDGVDRDGLQAALKEQGIPSMVYYPKPMHRQLAFEGAFLCPDGCPKTVSLCKTVLSLPMGPYVTEEDVRKVAGALKKALA